MKGWTRSYRDAHARQALHGRRLLAIGIMRSSLFFPFFSHVSDVGMYIQVPAPLAHYEKANWPSQGGQ